MRTSSRAFEAYAAVLFGVLLLLSFGMSAQAQDHSSTVDDIEAPRAVMANDSKYSIAPVVANERAKPRDIIKKELMLTNHTNERIDLYISVENIDPAEGAQEFVSPSVSDLAHSLANWIEVTRGVIKLGPGESRKVPYLIHVNLTAEPGSYFAHIAVTEGPRRPESASQEIGAELILNLEVEDDARERLQPQSGRSRLGPGQAAGDQRFLAGCQGVHRVALAQERPALPAAHRGRMGVRGARGNDDGFLVW